MVNPSNALLIALWTVNRGLWTLPDRRPTKKQIPAGTNCRDRPTLLYKNKL